MGHSTRKRSHGGGDYADPLLLGVVGLDNFARLELPDPPDGLEVDATYEYASGRIVVSFPGQFFSASALDLAAALALPPAAVGLPTGVGADFLSSTEAIAAVRKFVRDRLLLVDSEDCRTASEEVAAALQLVEVGKAYEVDWAGLVWALLKGEVVAGTPRRYVSYLLRLSEYQRPELFAEVDDRLPRFKRWKGTTLQPDRCTDVKLEISEECEVEEDKEYISVPYALSQDIGDFEEMLIFGEPGNCKGTFLEQEEVPEVGQKHTGLQSQSYAPSDAKLLGSDTDCDDGQGIAPLDAHMQTFAGSSFFARQLCALNEQDDVQLISCTKSQPAYNLQQAIEIDENSDDDSFDACLRSTVIRNGPLGISPYPVQQHGQTSMSFNDCLQQMSVHKICLEKGYSDKEKHCRQLHDEVQYLKKMVMEKQHTIDATRCDILKGLRANETKMYQFQKARQLMLRSVHRYKELLQKSSAEFRQYKDIMLRGKGFDSYLNVSGITYKQKHALMQQLHKYCLWLENNWCSTSLRLDEKLKQMAKNIANMYYEVRRLKESISIPDLNNGTGEDGEDQCNSEDRTRADEGDLVGSSEQKGKHLGESVENPAQFINTEGSMDVNKALGRCSEDEACQSDASHDGTS